MASLDTVMPTEPPPTQALTFLAVGAGALKYMSTK